MIISRPLSADILVFTFYLPKLQKLFCYLCCCLFAIFRLYECSKKINLFDNFAAKRARDILSNNIIYGKLFNYTKTIENGDHVQIILRNSFFE